MFGKIKVPKEILWGVLLFLLFAIVFSFFRLQIYAFNSWLLTMTGEIQQIALSENAGNLNVTADNKQQSKDGANKPKDNKATVTVKAVKKETSPLDSDKPVKSSLPLTAQSKIKLLASINTPDESKMQDFPELRSFTGTEWHNEKTVIKMATDGQSLYASFLCYDSNPNDLVTKYSESEGTSSAWKDDSIEFFLMKEKAADHYYQIVSSASGLSHIFYNKISDTKMSGSYSADPDLPKNFKKPFIRSEKCPEGFKITMEINLEGMGFDKLGLGDSILMQVVRNYRDSSNPKKATLQLYPTYIYVDNRSGPMNHDRKAFMPSKVLE